MGKLSKILEQVKKKIQISGNEQLIHKLMQTRDDNDKLLLIMAAMKREDFVRLTIHNRTLFSILLDIIEKNSGKKVFLSQYEPTKRSIATKDFVVILNHDANSTPTPEITITRKSKYKQSTNKKTAWSGLFKTKDGEIINY